jgi:hypothetical protein
VLFKIGNRIINTDNVTKVVFNPAPPPGTTSQAKPAALTVHFNFLKGNPGTGAEPETFSGHEADSLWKALSQSAQDVELKQTHRPR